MPIRYWLLKTEPSVFSIEDLARQPKKTTCWEGVRNYQARNFLRDQMHTGDRILLYHSNADPPGIAGTATVASEGYPDHFALDPKSTYFDPQSRRDQPRWFMVDVKLDKIFPRLLPRDELRGIAALKKMELLRTGSRLSVQPVRKSEFDAVLRLAARPAPRSR